MQTDLAASALPISSESSDGKNKLAEAAIRGKNHSRRVSKPEELG
jgi:hypothetical protein